MDSLEALKKALKDAAEAKIALRHAQANYDEAETRFVAGMDYRALGSNNNERDQQLAEKILANSSLRHLRKELSDRQDDADRAECELEQCLAERRHAEAVTWAKLADYLAGKVDHAGHAPTQAANRVLINELTGEVVGELSDDGETLYEIVEDEDVPF